MTRFYWGLFLILTFIISLPLSWWMLARVDFGYPFLYDTLAIDQHIASYAPKNKQGRKHFELTTKEQRLDLFHGVVEAIQNHGRGLKELAYTDKTNAKTVPLFTQAEITHLQDVANLLDILKVLVLSLMALWLLIVVILWRLKKTLPAVRQLLLSALMLLILSGLVLSIGPEVVFNQLHRWVFPDNHQWFFYYEDSLMSTMMKAPDLFAYIAGLLALLAMAISSLLVMLLRSFLK